MGGSTMTFRESLLALLDTRKDRESAILGAMLIIHAELEKLLEQEEQ
jgi:hypothetical protein